MDKKVKNQLIIIYIFLGLSLLLGFMNWLCKNSSNITNDLGIWLGSIGTIVAIIFVVLNTNKQIENQNKLEHRPMLRIEEILKASKEDFTEETHYELVSRDVSSYKDKTGLHTEIFEVLAVIENIGKGIAIQLSFFDPEKKDFSKDKYIFNSLGSQKKTIRKRIDKNKEIKASDIKEIPIRLKYNSYKEDIELLDTTVDFCNTIIMYSDIYGNVYMLFFEIRIEKNGIKYNLDDCLFYQQLYCGSRGFKKAITYYGLNQNMLIKKYTERFLDN